MAAKKLSTDKIITGFSGDGDVAAWLAKVELVARLTGEKDLATFIPLYLEGSALALYLELAEEKRADAALLKKELLRAFSDGEVKSFSRLKLVRWAGESIDVFATDIRKLARCSGFEGDGLEQMVKLAFVTGFPDGISVALQQTPDFEAQKVSDLIPRARVLTSNISVGAGGVAAPAVMARKSERMNDDETGKAVMKCYGCNGPHPVRFCPERKRTLKCFGCGGDHLVRFCPKGDFQKGSCGHAYDMGSSRLCVPVIEVHVNGQSARGLVDTGCTTTMIREQLAGEGKGRSIVAAFDGREEVQGNDKSEAGDWRGEDG